MKAVYEMPRVSMEMFNANEVVAACGQNVYKTFNCGTGSAYDSTTVLLADMECTNHANYLETTDDTIEFTSNGHSVNMDNSVTWSEVDGKNVAKATGASANSVFKGWVYLVGYDQPQQSGLASWAYGTTGWTVKDGSLSWEHGSAPDATWTGKEYTTGNSKDHHGSTSTTTYQYGRFHAMFAAVFGVFSAFSHS